MARQKSQDRISARGVGLKASEWAELEKIADDAGIKPHAVAAYAIRYFLKDYRAGKIKPQAKKIQSLPDL
jgi:hypothetical protein